MKMFENVREFIEKSNISDDEFRKSVIIIALYLTNFEKKNWNNLLENVGLKSYEEKRLPIICALYLTRDYVPNWDNLSEAVPEADEIIGVQN